MNTVTNFLQSIRPYGSASMLGAGLVALLDLIYPDIFHGDPDLPHLLLTGSLIGSGLFKMLKPSFSVISFYANILQICILRRLGIITKKRAAEFVDHTTTRRFQPPQSQQTDQKP